MRQFLPEKDSTCDGQREQNADATADLKRYLEKAGLTEKVEKEFAKAPVSTGLYYLHTDHLGTATYVTNSNGDTSQFFLNLPFGETRRRRVRRFH